MFRIFKSKKKYIEKLESDIHNSDITIKTQLTEIISLRNENIFLSNLLENTINISKSSTRYQLLKTLNITKDNINNLVLIYIENYKNHITFHLKDGYTKNRQSDLSITIVVDSNNNFEILSIPDKRNYGSGYGSVLMEEVISLAHQTGVKEIYGTLTAPKDQEHKKRLIGFYQTKFKFNIKFSKGTNPGTLYKKL
ncbi:MULTISPECIES: hypothetical protein [Priestia]|nr:MULTISPECIES: hypothetical protein [Priestia]MBY0077641.1 hypothetical protein [Priestia aryabhattai]